VTLDGLEIVSDERNTDLRVAAAGGPIDRPTSGPNIGTISLLSSAGLAFSTNHIDEADPAAS